jgi:DNA-binding IclR family transcriptional regulator
MKEEAASKAGGVDAVEVTGLILQAMLRLPRPVRLKDLETDTGIAAAKLHRYLVSMVRCGLVARESGGHRYGFGLLAYRMGQVTAQDASALALLEPYFDAFVARLGQPGLGQAVGIGQWMGRGATIVRWFESNAPLSIRSKPGVALSLTVSATAKLLAAYEPRKVTEPLVRQELQERGKESKAAVEAVYAEYASIRKDGLAWSLGARRRGLNALSVPLFDHEGRVIAAVTVLGMAPQFDAAPQGPTARLLRRLGKELSVRLGHRGNARVKKTL